jgi:hypothetical protein
MFCSSVIPKRACLRLGLAPCPSSHITAGLNSAIMVLVASPAIPQRCASVVLRYTAPYSEYPAQVVLSHSAALLGGFVVLGRSLGKVLRQAASER